MGHRAPSTGLLPAFVPITASVLQEYVLGKIGFGHISPGMEETTNTAPEVPNFQSPRLPKKFLHCFELYHGD